MEESFVTGKPVRASIPSATRRGKPHGASGRVCSHPGCTTVLSVYNGSPTCWTHQDGTMTSRSERFSRSDRDPAGHAIPPAA